MQSVRVPLPPLPSLLSPADQPNTVTPAKPGVYGQQKPPAQQQQQQQQRPVTFAPNVTPVTFTDNDDLLFPSSDPLNPTASCSPTATLFPPSETPAPAPTRKRCPPGKRRSQGYIPRPPNAFMLFRADFVRQKHVPGSIETNHGSLSKIIGMFHLYSTMLHCFNLIHIYPRSMLASTPVRRETCLGGESQSRKGETQSHVPALSFPPRSQEETRRPRQ